MPRDFFAEEIEAVPKRDYFAEEITPTPLPLQLAKKAITGVAIPGFAGPISQRVVERPEESLRAIGTTYGLARYPASLALSALIGKQFQRPQVGEFVEQARQRAAEQPFIRGGIPQIPTGIVGEIARRTTPEQFKGVTRGLAQVGTFATSAALKLDPLLKDLSKKVSVRAIRALPRIHGKDYLINRARQTGEGLEQVYDSFEPQYDSLFNRIGNKVVSKSKVQEIANTLPSNIVKRIAKSDRIILNPDGSMTPTINNLREVKSILQQSLPRQIRRGMAQATPEQGEIKFALSKIRDLMAEGNPELLALNKRYGDFLKLKEKVSGVIYDRFGNPKSGGLSSLFKRGAERSKQIAFENLSKVWPQAQQVIKDTQKYAAREGAKALSIKIFGTAARWGILYPLFRSLGGGGFGGG